MPATNRISSALISVVVQGPVLGNSSDTPEERYTKRSLQSIRVFLPQAEIILSTWKGADVAGLEFDKIVFNDDPGACEYHGGGGRNNVNRQIVSTFNGMRIASRDYVLKLRSDSVLTGSGFLDYFGHFPQRSAKSVFAEKVVASSRGSFIPNYRMLHSCYFPSDWFHFGRRADLLDLWDIPLAPEPETTHWLPPGQTPWHDQNPRLRFSIEQYIWVSFLKKHFTFRFDSMWDQSDSSIADSELSIGSNLILISPEQASIRSLKYPDFWGFLDHCRQGCYTHGIWRSLYEEHCRGKQVSVHHFIRLFYWLLFKGADSVRFFRRLISHSEPST